MDLDDSKLRSVRDGGVLHELPNGIQVVRRKKHEPIDMAQLTKGELARRTDKRNGSKFLPEISLKRIVEMTCQVLIEKGAEVGANIPYNRAFDHPIGYSNGRPVKGLWVSRSNKGKLAHAYPVDERRL